MFSLPTTATITLASALVFQSPGPAKAPKNPAEFKPAETAMATSLLEETYVTVSGLEGRLVVLPSILKEFNLRPGQEISQEMMYQILERNRKLK